MAAPASSPSFSGNGNSRKVTRTRTGCLTCRRRKKKCDEERCPITGACIRCKQAGYQCEGFPELRFIQSSGAAYKNRHLLRRRSTINSDKSSFSSSPPLQTPAGTMRDSGGDDVDGMAALHAAASSLAASHSPPNPSGVLRSAPNAGQPLGPPSAVRHATTSFSSYNGQAQPQTSAVQTMQLDTAPSPNLRRGNTGTPILPTTGQAPGALQLGLHQTDLSSPAQRASTGGRQGGPQSQVCTFIGECILLGRAICENCLSTIEPLFSPSDPTPHFQQPTPSSSSAASAFSPREAARHQPVMQSLIGYFSALVTCWVEGCYPQAIAESSFFRQLVQHLISTIDQDEALRLSVAAVASGYIGGGQLQWPEDLVAIQRWTETLRQDATELVDVTTSSSSNQLPRADMDSSTGERLARHSYIDRHLSKHAMLFYRMAKRAVEEAVQRASRQPSSSFGLNGTRPLPPSATDGYVDAEQMRCHNNLLLSTINLCIFSWAEMSIGTYYADFDMALQAAHTLFGGVRRVKIAHLNSMDTIGLAVVVWADTCAAIARGTRPYFELDDTPLTSKEREMQGSAPPFAFNSFNCPPALFKCLNDLARLRFDCKATPLRGLSESGASSPLSASLAQRASQLESRLKALSAETQHSSDANGQSIPHTRADGTVLIHTGSPNCSEMTRLACLLILYTAIYGKGPLYPACKFALQNIVHLWTYGAIGFCRAVGCSNYLLPVFMASAVACEARDRMLCEEAMNIVGHNEAVCDSARMAIRETWRRTDEAGFPALWTDVVKQNSFEVAFL